jgi:hypothetical protein
MRTVRITLDIPEEEHFYFKMACVKLKTTLKMFFLEAGEKRLEEIENEWLAEEVNQVKARVAESKETFEPLENVIKDLGLENEIPNRIKQHRKKIS